MATTISSAAIVPVTPVFSNTERLALAGFLAGYSGLTRQAYELDLRQYAAGASSTGCACSPPAAPRSRASPGTWRPAAGPALPSPGGCARSPGCTGTRSRKNYSTTHPLRTYADPSWTTNLMRPAWTATSSALCWSLPAWGLLRSMR